MVITEDQHGTVKMIKDYRGGSRDFEKGALYVGHHSWLRKEILGFRWSKKTNVTLETKSFWQKISTSIFKFSPFLYTMKACRWNLNQFFKIYTLWWGKRKTLMQQRKIEERICFIKSCFIKLFKIKINQAHSQPNFRFLVLGWRNKYQKGKLWTTNS